MDGNNNNNRMEKFTSIDLNNDHQQSPAIDESKFSQNQILSSSKNCCKCYEKLWIFPLIAGTFIIFTSWITYYWALKKGLVDPIFPYLSDTGALYPVAGFFSMALDFHAISLAITHWIRYKQIQYYIEKLIPSKNQQKSYSEILERISKYNKICLRLGLIIAFGSVIVGNFRSGEHILPHSIGAMPIFILNVIFGFYQISICRELYQKFEIESQPKTLTIIVYILLIVEIITGLITFASVFYEGKEVINIEARSHWKPEREGYWFHVASAVGEWIVIYDISFIYLCLTRRIKLFSDWNKIF